jgi:hypothetical protein
MTNEEILTSLRDQNPRLRDDVAIPLATALYEYGLAQSKINDQGVLSLHPRTGSPMENPYLQVRERSRRTIKDLCAKRNVKTDGLWGLPPG